MKSVRAILIAALAALVEPAYGAVTATVDPGGLVVWRGDGVLRCQLGERSWPAGSAQRCIYPIDLYTTVGPLTLQRQTARGPESRVVVVNPYPYETQIVDLPDDTMVNLTAADLARVERNNAATAALWPLETTASAPDLPLSPPLQPLPPGGRFGSRRVFNGQPRSPHSGADYSAPKGTPVLAAAAGKVVLADEHFFAGNSVFIDHGQGLITMYFHLDKIVVSGGATVARGQKIAEVGATGRATGPHLHFGARWHGQRINPELLLRPGEQLITVE